VIKLLKRLYEIILDEQAKTVICQKILSRIRDEDSNIKVGMNGQQRKSGIDVFTGSRC